MQGWPEERTRHTLHALLAWSATSSEAVRWSKKLAALPLAQNPEARVASVVELLKYPQAAGAATDEFLELLKKTDPTAPEKDQGLPATLRWLAATYPTINLDARPACPTPPISALKCPAAPQ